MKVFIESWTCVSEPAKLQANSLRLRLEKSGKLLSPEKPESNIIKSLRIILGK